MPPLPSETDANLVREAVKFLKQAILPIQPRKKWPDYKNIDPRFIFQPGRALSAYGDSGWGQTVVQSKYEDNRFSDELVTACVALVSRWKPYPAPRWVTCIPSLRRPNLVPDFAKRLARALNLPFRPLLVRMENRPEQKTMQNSAQQAQNVQGSIKVVEQPHSSPVLLVDDMVDSGWTFTVAAELLRSHGSGEVWPLALAQTGDIQ